MTARALVCAAVVLNLAAAAASFWLTTRPDAPRLEEMVGPLTPDEVFVGLAWAITGAVLAWLRPWNALGWLFLGAGTCAVLQVALAMYGEFGVLIADPSWPFARWTPLLVWPLLVLGLLPLANLVPALYPRGALPSSRWRLPVTASCIGIGLLALAAALDPGSYDEILPGQPAPLSAPRLALVMAVAALVILVPGTLAIWAMSVVRLKRSRPPERQQLAWLLFVVIPLFIFMLVPATPEWAWDLALYLIPVSIGIGIFRHNLLGIEVVLRRGLVYGVLTAAIVAVYLAVTLVAGSQLHHDPIAGWVAAVLVAVGLTPLRERLQRAADRLVYGERRDPLSAVTRLGDQVADEPDLLRQVLRVVTTAVRAPGASVVSRDGRLVASYGSTPPGTSFGLRVSGVDVGTLEVAARSPGEPYTDGDNRLLDTLVPQVAVVVRALELAEALEAERDLVVSATRTERDRLRRDLHDGLGPSLSGIRFGLLALDEAVAARDDAATAELLGRIRAEMDATVGEVRRIIDGLRPAVLDATGLAGALRCHADGVSAGVHIDFAAQELPPLPPQVETAAYHIAQEALNNVVRHAAAMNARITLAMADGALTVQVTDDGAGIDGPPVTGVGLDSMRRRAEALGGTLALASSNQGTTILATLPLAEAAP